MRGVTAAKFLFDNEMLNHVLIKIAALMNLVILLLDLSNITHVSNLKWAGGRIIARTVAVSDIVSHQNIS